MRLYLALFVSILVPVSALAVDITSHKQPFTVFCVGGGSIGFNKVQGNWTEQRFKPRNRIVKKTILASEPFAAYPGWCHDARTSEPPANDGVSTTSVGCYTFAEPGEQVPLSSNCTENWRALTASTDALNWLRCSDGLFEFRINLETLDYVRSQIYAFAATGPNPDSLVLEIGKCSFIE